MQSWQARGKRSWRSDGPSAVGIEYETLARRQILGSSISSETLERRCDGRKQSCCHARTH